MKKNFTLKASAAAIALAFAGTAAAADLGEADGFVYASEIAVDATDGTTITVSGTVVGEIGVGLVDDEQVYVRFELPEGVTFGATQPTLQAQSVAADGTTFADITGGASTGSITRSLGGSGENYVVFALQPNTGENFETDSSFTFTGGSLVVKGQSDVSIDYSAHTTLSEANSGSGKLGAQSLSDYVSFDAALTAGTLSPVESLVANVSDEDGAYFGFTTATAGEPLLSAHVELSGTILDSDASTFVIADLVDATASNTETSIVVNGDFSWVSDTKGVTLHSNDSCSSEVAVASLSEASDKATFAIDGSALTAEHFVCVTPSGEASITSGDYDGSVDLAEASTSYSIASIATGDGSIERNGSALRAPFINNFVRGGVVQSSQLSAVQLQNNSAKSAPFSVTCYGYSGTSTGGTGEVPAQSTRRYSLEQLGCGTNTSSVDLSFEAASGSLDGVMVRRNLSTGDVAVETMVDGNN